MAKKIGDYEVGYGKPPKSCQFKKGQTGNAKGRRKGARGLKTVLNEELKEKMTITENGKRRKLTKQQLVIKQLMNKALKGDIRALTKIFELNISVLGVEDEATKASASLSNMHQSILDNYVRRLTNGGDADDG